MVKKVCHLLISYGNKNQEYTSNLIEGLRESSRDEHFVFCHHAYTIPENIKVVVSYNIKKFNMLLKLLRMYILDKEFRVLFKRLNKKELKKWVWLIEYKINVLHIHHEH